MNKKSPPKAKKPAKAEPKPAKQPKSEEGRQSHPGRRGVPPRHEGRENPGTNQPAVGRQLGRADEGRKLAGPQRPRVHLRELGKKLGLKVESAKREGDGERVYTVAK